MITLFENLIGQKRFVDRIQSEVESKILPSAILFSGEECSGKLTAAIELSRALTCKHQGAWNCGCSDCKDHRTLSHSSSILLGKRNFMPEIQAAISFAKRGDDSIIARFMMIRSVNKLTSRFHPALADAMANPLKKAGTPLDSLKELLSPVYPGGNPGWYSDKWAARVIKQAEIIQNSLPEMVSVNEIRAINRWSHQSGHENRTVIIENADKLNNSSANALLKILEEPPKGLYFILLTPKRGALLPTIISRVRIYSFANRHEREQQDVIKRVFREADPYVYSGIKDYLYDISGVDIDQFEKFAQTLILSMSGDKTSLAFEYESIIEAIDSKLNFKVFLEKLIKTIQLAGTESSMISKAIDFDIASRWNELIRETWIMNNGYNQSSKALLESLFFRMKNDLQSTVAMDSI